MKFHYCPSHRRIQELKLGEGPRSSAEGAKEGGVWGEGVRLTAPNFLDFGSKWRIFVDSWCFNDLNSIEIHQEYKDCRGDWLACDKERYSGVYIPLKSLEQVPLLSQDEAPQASTGWGMGREYPLPSWLEVWGSVVSSTREVRGRAPAKNEFDAFWASQNSSACKIS